MKKFASHFDMVILLNLAKIFLDISIIRLSNQIQLNLIQPAVVEK